MININSILAEFAMASILTHLEFFHLIRQISIHLAISPMILIFFWLNQQFGDFLIVT